MKTCNNCTSTFSTTNTTNTANIPTDIQIDLCLKCQKDLDFDFKSEGKYPSVKLTDKNECTFHETKETFHFQYWYSCQECFPYESWRGPSEGVCDVCANSCKEQNHSLKKRFGPFFCDKGVQRQREEALQRKLSSLGDNSQNEPLEGSRFIVDPVDICNKLLPFSPQRKAWGNIVSEKIYSIEACDDQNIIAPHGDWNAFVSTVHRAYDNHYPLVLSPDNIWLVITQGFAQHIDQHSEELRERFVNFTGKQRIVVQIDDFVKGSSHNPWMSVFPQFSEQIKNFIGDENHELIMCNYSTTGPLERAVSEIVLMDAMKNYFSYGCGTCCGIPTIRLTGKLEDWTKIRQKIDQLGTFNLSWWTDSLKLVIDEFILAYRGIINKQFWRNFYKFSNPGSGEPYVTGWINTLFPYLSTYGEVTRNMYVTYNPKDRSRCHGPSPNDFPASYSQVSFDWMYMGQSFNMAFIGGFCGSTQNLETFELSPALGWAVAEKTVAEKTNKK